MVIVGVSPKGQILIPKRLRNKFGVRPAGKVQLLEAEGAVLVKPSPEDPLEVACGFLKGDFSLTNDLLEEHRKEQDNE